MSYVERREFVVRFEVRCEFSDDYEGEEDGYEWAKDFPAIAAEIVGSAMQIVRRHPGWSVHPANRGRSSDDEVTLVVERAVGTSRP
jgi:hypothetical protein